MNIYFDIAFKFVCKWEGGLSNDEDDPGGLTKYGISKAAFPNIDIGNLTIDGAKEIYKKYYWDKCKCDFLPPKTAVVVFDFAVNGGPKKSIKILQQAITECGFPIEIDGLIGSTTLKFANMCNEDEILKNCISAREEYYDLIVRNNQKLLKFRNGWQNRVNDLKSKVGL